MKIAKRRCEFCHKWYLPNPRTYLIQRCCTKPECHKKRKAGADKAWRNKNQGYDKGKGRRKKIRSWARSYPDYWQKYRQEHPEYVKKDNKRRHTSHKKEKNAAKQDTIRKISVEKLKSIKEIKPDSAAKQDAIQHRQNGILDYLFWKESAAKQVLMVNHIYKEP